jgi:glucose-1-phosphate thymidylyltransferase
VTTTATTTGRTEAPAAGSGANDPRLKGLVLSGGKGSRLRPFTYTNAKQLVPSQTSRSSSPSAARGSGITDIAIVIGDTGEQVACVGDGGSSARHYVHQQDAARHRPRCRHRPRLLGDSRFVMYLGDNFVMGGIRSYVSFTAATPARRSSSTRPQPEAFGIARWTAP